MEFHWWKWNQKIVFNLCPWLCRQNWILVNVPHTFPAGLPWHSIHVDASRSTYTNLCAHFQRALWFHTVLRGQKVERIVPHHELSEPSWPRWHICQPCQKESTDLSFTLTFKWLPSRHGLSRQRFFVHVHASNCNQNNCLECAKSDDVGQHRGNVPQKLVFAILTQEPTPMFIQSVAICPTFKVSNLAFQSFVFATQPTSLCVESLVVNVQVFSQTYNFKCPKSLTVSLKNWNYKI